jgi:hypothetical protein
MVGVVSKNGVDFVAEITGLVRVVEVHKIRVYVVISHQDVFVSVTIEVGYGYTERKGSVVHAGLFGDVSERIVAIVEVQAIGFEGVLGFYHAFRTSISYITYAHRAYVFVIYGVVDEVAIEVTVVVAIEEIGVVGG